jgi:class 3 adenylate cyclase
MIQMAATPPLWKTSFLSMGGTRPIGFQRHAVHHSSDCSAGALAQRGVEVGLGDGGDTVNTAARMEAHGIAGEIQVTPETRALLKPNYHLEERGWIDIKGKGLIQVYLLKGKR